MSAHGRHGAYGDVVFLTAERAPGLARVGLAGEARQGL